MVLTPDKAPVTTPPSMTSTPLIPPETVVEGGGKYGLHFSGDDAVVITMPVVIKKTPTDSYRTVILRLRHKVDA